MKDCIGIILAAGESTRMKSDLPKALHELCGRPMIEYVFDALAQAHVKRKAIVLSKKQEALLAYLKPKKDVKVIFQPRPLGTADALKSARSLIAKSKENTLVMCVDTPLVRKETLEALMAKHKETHASATMVTAYVDNPASLGRVVRDEFSKVCRIIEENDASFAQKQIKEINSGIYCFRAHELLSLLPEIAMNEKKKEFYLTDIIQLLYEHGKRIETCDCSDADEIIGINSRSELSKAGECMRLRIIEECMREGVTIVSPQTTFIHYGSVIGTDTVIHPFTFIEAGVRVGEQCSIGPFCRLRKGTVIKDKTQVGNFTEVNRSSIGKNSRMKHFGYLGDTSVGDSVNIGAGTVIANYDGQSKNRTVIKDKSFIGCDTVIVAPAVIGKGATTGAGTVVTRMSNIKDNSVVVGVPARPLAKKALEKKPRNNKKGRTTRKKKK